MNTTHRILIGDSRAMKDIGDETVDLVVTSPPYPMIEMWDHLFSSLSPAAGQALASGDGNAAFEAMHAELDVVWGEIYRVLKGGSFVCINIGDATRTMDGRFRLYSNHSRIIRAFLSLGFDSLPVILWRKQTNAPNKFMGSGMLPAGAYVTLEHEYILLFRKSSKRLFTGEHDKADRMRSAFFWEERNKWFSDVWDFKGTTQRLNHGDLRSRSGAYPFELAYRLINMYSLYEDTVLDPFLGTGTTTLAALACGRNSVGVEIDSAFSSFIAQQVPAFLGTANELAANRIAAHGDFMDNLAATKGAPKYANGPHGFPVVTRQETGLQLYRVAGIYAASDTMITASYEPLGVLDSAASVAKEEARLRTTGARQLTLDL